MGGTTTLSSLSSSTAHSVPATPKAGPASRSATQPRRIPHPAIRHGACTCGVTMHSHLNDASRRAAHPWPLAMLRSRLDMMQPLRAKVVNGRLVLDEPTDLPEGRTVYLCPVEAEADDRDDDDGFEDAERAALMNALDDGIAAAKNGDHGNAGELTRKLLASR